jgi:hypothetical protein
MSDASHPAEPERTRGGYLLLFFGLAAGLGTWAGFQFLYPPRDARALDDAARLTREKQQLENELQATRLRIAAVERSHKADLAPLEKTAADLKERLDDTNKRLMTATQNLNDAEKALRAAQANAKKAADDLAAERARAKDGAELKKAVTKAEDALQKEKAKVTAAERSLTAALTAKVKAEQERDALKKETARAVRPEPTDVLLVAMNSGNLSLHRYKNLFRELVDPAKRSLASGCRIGMGLADGANWVPIAGFDDDDPKKLNEAFGYFEPANRSSTDNLNDVREPVKSAFEKSKAAKRCVVVASLRCRPPAKSAFDDWKGLELTVILIGSEDRAGDLGKDRLREWFEFCHAVGGQPVQLLGTPKDPEDPDDGLIDRVRRALRLATQPRYSPGR